MLHAVILLLKALLHFSTLCIHNPPTKRQQASLATQFCSLQMVIYNTIILYAQILFFATCEMTTNEGVCFGTSHDKNDTKICCCLMNINKWIFTSYTLPQHYWKAPGTDHCCVSTIQCCILWAWRETHSIFLHGPICTLNIWEEVAWKEQ